MRPILILTPTGRTGTTLLISMLGCHSKIIICNEYPYEVRRFQSAIVEGNLEGSGDALRYYSKEAAQSRKRAVCFAAEKYIGLDLKAAKHVMPGALFLPTIRDPRDVLVSINAFDKKRSYCGFALQHGDSQADAIQKLGGAFRLMIKVLGEYGLKPVRYESLIAERRKTMDEIFRSMHLKPRLVNAAPEHVEHRTSETGKLSIQRWKRDLTPSTRALCRREWTDILSHFSYDLD